MRAYRCLHTCQTAYILHNKKVVRPARNSGDFFVVSCTIKGVKSKFLQEESQNEKGDVGGRQGENTFQRARVNAGLSQEKAAEALDCGTRSLQGYESGRNEPAVSVLLKMWRLYRCRISELYPPFREQVEPSLRYRMPTCVSAVRVYRDSVCGTTSFPICPRCGGVSGKGVSAILRPLRACPGL